MHYIFYRCQIAVHQECYGAKNVRDFTSWVCKACETPDIKRECCLCPVKGLSCTMFQTYAISSHHLFICLDWYGLSFTLWILFFEAVLPQISVNLLYKNLFV